MKVPTELSTRQNAELWVDLHCKEIKTHRKPVINTECCSNVMICHSTRAANGTGRRMLNLAFLVFHKISTLIAILSNKHDSHIDKKLTKLLMGVTEILLK